MTIAVDMGRKATKTNKTPGWSIFLLNCFRFSINVELQVNDSCYTRNSSRDSSSRPRSQSLEDKRHLLHKVDIQFLDSILTFCMLGIFHDFFCHLLIFFFQNQCYHFVRPNLGPNCLQRSSADGTSRHRVNFVIP